MEKQIPFKLLELEPGSFHPIVEGTIDGLSVKLIIDTGASRTVIDSSLTKNLLVIENHVDEPFAAGINAQRISVQQVEVPSLSLNGIDFGRIIAFTADLTPISKLYQEILNFPIHGLLGCDFLVNNKANIDIDLGILTIRYVQ